MAKKRRKEPKHRAEQPVGATDRSGDPHRLAREYGRITRDRGIPPALRGFSDDDDVPVIIQDQGEEQPPGAVQLIGELSVPVTVSDGTVIQPGAKLWLSSKDPAEIAAGATHTMQFGDIPRVTSLAGEELAARHGTVQPGATVVRLPRDHSLAQLPSPAGHLVPDPREVPARRSEPGRPVMPSTPRPLAARRGVAAEIQTEVPAAFRRPGKAASAAAQNFVRALADEGLAERAAEGFTAEQLQDPELLQAIGRAARRAGGDPSGAPVFRNQETGQFKVVRGGTQGTVPAKIITKQPGVSRDLPGGLRAGDIIAAQRPAGYQPAGIGLPEGYEGDPGDQVWRPLAATAGGGPEIIVTNDLNALDVTDADLVIEDLDPDDPDDSGRVLMGSLGQVQAYHRQTEAADKRAAQLIPGTADQSGLARTREAAEAITLRDNWTAANVLAAHDWLTRHYRNPHDDLADYIAFHMRNSLDQDHRTASMFWPVDLEKGAGVPQGAQMAQLIARGLGSARTIQVTAKMCGAMRAEWDAAPGQLLVLDEGVLPVPAGFAWLDAPWLTELDAGYWLPVRAVSWERTAVLASSRHGSYLGLAPGDAPRMLDAVRVVLWLRIPDDVAFGRWKGQERRAIKVANRVGNLVPQQIAILPFGVRINTGRGYRTNGQELLSLLHTLWKTLGETLPKSRPVRAAMPGGSRQAARRTLKHDDVHIITLREYTYDSDPEPHHPQAVNWTCRWWVHEFYRHIDHYDDGTDDKGRRRKHQAVPASQPGLLPDDDHDVCGVCLANGQTVRISHIAGFDKGPPGLPYRKPAEERTVYRLAR